MNVRLPARPRRGRLLERRAVRERLISVADLAHRPVLLADGRHAGTVVDVVCRWEGERYPAVTGLVVRVGRRKVFVPAEQLERFERDRVLLASAVVDLRDFAARSSEVVLLRDVVDHQLVDVDGIQVVRANDLYLADIKGHVRLVGVEIGARSLLRRLAPARWRTAASPERVLDWGGIEPFGTGDGDTVGGMRLDRSRQELQRMRPAEVARLLEELGRPQRQHLLALLDTPAAADALEEMDGDERDQLLRETTADRAAAILAAMEPDEAAEALREIDDDGRGELLDLLPEEERARVRSLLVHDPDRAGGIMTSIIVTATPADAVGAIATRLLDLEVHRDDIDGVLVLDDDGRLVDDISLFELFTTPSEAPIGDLVGEPWPLTVDVDTSLDAVLDALLSNRRSSVVVVDHEHRPLGRILADDVLDALATNDYLRRRTAS
ncbi:MAG: CBS domain-containing protein [Acidimicrobiia bacterium]